MFLFLSTGLATLRYGDAFLLERIRSLQLHEGWPGHELPRRGFGRAVGIAFGVALLGLDFLVLIGSIVDAALRSELITAVVYLTEFMIALTWIGLLRRWIRRYRPDSRESRMP